MLTAPAKTAVDKAHRASVYTFTDLNQVFKHSKGYCLMKKLSTDNDLGHRETNRLRARQNPDSLVERVRKAKPSQSLST